MRKLVYSLLVTGAFMSASSHSQVLTIGSGIGKDCYNAALYNPSPKKSHERICRNAIETPGLNRRDLAASYINRGIIRMRMSNYSEALEDYAAARKLRPNLGAIYLNQGAAMIGAGHLEDAVTSLEKALELDTQDPHSAYFNLGLAYELSGKATEAYYAFQKALELRPDWDLPKEELKRYSVVSTG